jgi:hypothetical protein
MLEWDIDGVRNKWGLLTTKRQTKREILSEIERFSLFWRKSDPVENVLNL